MTDARMPLNSLMRLCEERRPDGLLLSLAECDRMRRTLPMGGRVESLRGLLQPSRWRYLVRRAGR